MTREVPPLHEILRLERATYVLDAETTGVDRRESRIIELGLQKWEPGALAAEWRTLVDPGVPIPPETTAVHGITDAMVRACRHCGAAPDAGCACLHPWPTFRRIARPLARALSACDFAGKNVRFDLDLLAAEFARAGVPWDFEGARIIDAEQIERLLEPRTLSALYRRRLGREMDGAHAALSDVRASSELIAAQLEDFAGAPRTMDALHALLWPGWLDAGGYFTLGADGIPRVGRWGKYSGRPMREVPRDYWKYMCDKDFPPGAKAIAAAAIRGELPGAPKQEGLLP